MAASATRPIPLDSVPAFLTRPFTTRTVEIGDFACFIGLFCLIGGLTLMNVRRTNLIPLRDPRLREGLNFHNI